MKHVDKLILGMHFHARGTSLDLGLSELASAFLHTVTRL